MTREQATKQLIKYKSLKGRFSSNFNSIVEDVFVGHDDHRRARTEYETTKGNIENINSDKPADTFIVWVKFDTIFVPAKYVEVE